MHNQPPQVESFRDLCYLGEVSSTADDGSHKFSRFAVITHDYHVWIGQAPIRNKDLSPKNITDSLKLILDEDVYPEPPSHITSASVSIDGNVFVKGPKVGGYNAFAGTGALRKLLLQEAETLEILRRNQPPTIIRYHGSIIRRGRIVGLVLDRHPRTLELEARLKKRKIDSDMCFDGIKAAVEHLHSLGLAHNDLNSYNIMMDEDGTPVLIDYGSYQPFGKSLLTAGTPGWVDENFTTSAQRNDEIALGKLQVWLKEQTR
ncbi:serine/threonine-protein kinase-like protein [Trematosphaeria pertusa]|uniref:Serine/threonine-protein kinase-like protein n=1 Tax=Trematosphaeria pertusa TaxID=390896 RepID=A0A6A6HUQ8_9PLEO|nr:serine/threonine-protein kinase-like protein [Trematosphaeria pertusa]KAF2241904.1 serine/threonine-protein kinase-like protein [Trematosphaeria pertusa]